MWQECKAGGMRYRRRSTPCVPRSAGAAPTPTRSSAPSAPVRSPDGSAAASAAGALLPAHGSVQGSEPQPSGAGMDLPRLLCCCVVTTSAYAALALSGSRCGNITAARRTGMPARGGARWRACAVVDAEDLAARAQLLRVHQLQPKVLHPQLCIAMRNASILRSTVAGMPRSIPTVDAVRLKAGSRNPVSRHGDPAQQTSMRSSRLFALPDPATRIT